MYEMTEALTEHEDGWKEKRNKKKKQAVKFFRIKKRIFQIITIEA